MDYLRGLSKEKYEKVIKECIDKVEKVTSDSWSDIIERNGLQMHPDILRKAITGPFGTYSYTKVYGKKGLDEIREEVGEIDLIKKELREKNSRISKLNTKLSKSVQIAEDIKYYLREDIGSIEKINYKRIRSKSEYKLLVVVSDWHIGYIIKNYRGNTYNYEIAKRRLAKLISEIKEIALRYKAKDIIVVQAGDIIENTYMRETQQAFECEFSASEQVSKAIKLFYEFITTISEFANVDVYSLGGNHSRISSKAANIDGDNYNVIINETIKMLVDISENKRIRVGNVDYIEDSCMIKTNGLTIKAFHGDKKPKEAKKLYDTEISLECEKIDIIIRGHHHNFEVSSQNNGGYVVTNGSLFGYNPYSNDVIRSNSHASQTVIVLGDKEIESIKSVNLQID